MILEIIGLVLAIIGFILFLPSYSDGEGSDLITCCSLIILLFIIFLYIYLNNYGRFLLLFVIYTIYFIKNPEDFSSITRGLGDIVKGIISLFESNDDNSTNDYRQDNSRYYHELNTPTNNNSTNDNTQDNTGHYSELNTSINNNENKEKPKKDKSTSTHKENKNKDESHYYLNQLDINRATKEELENTDGISKITAKKIIDLRKKGTYITSYRGLKDLLNISAAEEVTMIKNIYISDYMKDKKPKKENKYKKPIRQYDLTQKQRNTKKPLHNNNQTPRKKEKVYKKVDINKANYEDINGIPGITSLMASKIIKLRANGEYIESFDDLKDVLNLSQFQLDKIKGYIIINYDSKKSRKKTKQTDSKKKKINFNTCELNELRELNILSSEDITKITVLRRNGVSFNSFEDLEHKAEINHLKIIKLQELIILEPNTDEKSEIIDPDENMKKIDNILDDNRKDQNKSKTENNSKKDSSNKKIDINTGDEQTLSKIPHINIIKAKKIIDLRNQNIYIKSYEDLESKLNLNHSQIEKIKEVTIISKPKLNTVRVLDI